MLTYGDEPLLIPDEDGELNAWLEETFPIAEMSIFGGVPSCQNSARHFARDRSESNKGVGLPVFNYAPPPRPRINSLWWPTGATRWARGFFLADAKTKDTIVARAHGGSADTALDLIWSDETEPQPGQQPAEPLKAKMHLLPPRPISAIEADAKNDETLWLLPLVDERYWWQFASSGDFPTWRLFPEPGSDSASFNLTWSELLSYLRGKLKGNFGILSGDVESDYADPDQVEFIRRYENSALLLEAALHSIGRRFVRQLNGDSIIETAEEAADTLKESLEEGGGYLIAGGEITKEKGVFPEQVEVVFRKVRQYLFRSNGQVHVVTEDHPSRNKPVAEDRKMVIRAAMYAGYDFSDVLANSAKLNSLAEKIAEDYYKWTEHWYDYSFAGLHDWTLCGFDDSVLWHMGSPMPATGRRLCRTRVASLSPHIYPDTNGCQDLTARVVEPYQIGKAITTTGKSAFGLFYIYAGTLPGESNSGSIVAAWNRTATINPTQWVTLAGIGDAQWYVAPLECESSA